MIRFTTPFLNFSLSARTLTCLSSFIGSTSFDPVIESVSTDDEFRSDECLFWLTKLQPFSGTLVDVVPMAADPSQNLVSNEKNSCEILNYVRSQLLRNGVTEQTFETMIKPIDASKTKSVFKDKITLLKKLLSNKKYRGFMEAISVSVQFSRELTQQVGDIGISVEDFQENLENQNTIAKAKSKWGLYTSKKDYILKVPLAEKRHNQNEFDKWLSNFSTELTKIVSLTVSDLPLNYGTAEQASFEADPTNVSKKRALLDVLNKLQRECVSLYKADKINFKVESFLTGK